MTYRFQWSIARSWPPRPLPPAKGRWASWLTTQRERNATPEAQVRGVESQGATAEELADLVMGMYLPLFPRFLGLSRGFMKDADLSPRDVPMNLWALGILEDGWRVLEVFGTNPLDLVAWALAHRRPAEWMDQSDLLRMPLGLRDALHPEGLEFLLQGESLDLGWLWQMAGSLRIFGPASGVRLPKRFRCYSEVLLHGIGGFAELKEWEAKQLDLEECLDLTTIQLHSDTPLRVQGCPRLKSIHGKLPLRLVVEDCQELEALDVIFPHDALPGPSLAVRRCPSLKTIGRPSGRALECKDLLLEDCPSLKNLQTKLTVRRERHIAGCPGWDALS